MKQVKSQMTIGKKLSLSFGAALALTLAVALVSLLGISSLSAQIEDLVGKQSIKLFLAGEIAKGAAQLVANERGILLNGQLKDVARVNQYKQSFEDSATQMGKGVQEVIPLLQTAEGRQLGASMQTDLQTILRNHQEVYRMVASGGAEAAVLRFREMLPVIERLDASADRMVKLQQGIMLQVKEASATSIAQSRWTMTGMIALSLLVGIASGFTLRGINRVLRQTVAELGEGTQQTASAASQVSASSHSLAQAASEQAASLEETAASSEEINSIAGKNTENSRAASAEMGRTAELVAATNARLDEMVTSMKGITDSSNKISKIIKVIDEIAFQTNILALNAAVEAARAGEAGMGFAVVADEVRNLAQRSAQAARDTADLIAESIEKSTVGSRNLDLVAEGVRTITNGSAQVKTLVEEVSLGSGEQARGIEQIAKAIAQMEHVTQNSAASAEEGASAAAELNAQSDALQGIVQRLAALVGGAECSQGRAAGSRKLPAGARPVATAPRGSSAGRSLMALRAAVGRAPAPRPVPVTAAVNAGLKPFDLDAEI